MDHGHLQKQDGALGADDGLHAMLVHEALHRVVADVVTPFGGPVGILGIPVDAGFADEAMHVRTRQTHQGGIAGVDVVHEDRNHQAFITRNAIEILFGVHA